jgi:regulator of telomere elongation helicase 1
VFPRSVPDGLLVFFPSYGVMSSCLEFWREHVVDGLSLWERIGRHKQPVVEPRDAADFAAVSPGFLFLLLLQCCVKKKMKKDSQLYDPH